MSNNLIITYDLNQPGQNYDDVIGAIKALGTTVKVNQSVWYVFSKHTASSAFKAVASVADENDNIFVFDASNNARMGRAPKSVIDAIEKLWP